MVLHNNKHNMLISVPTLKQHHYCSQRNRNTMKRKAILKMVIVVLVAAIVKVVKMMMMKKNKQRSCRMCRTLYEMDKYRMSSVVVV